MAAWKRHENRIDAVLLEVLVGQLLGRQARILLAARHIEQLELGGWSEQVLVDAGRDLLRIVGNEVGDVAIRGIRKAAEGAGTELAQRGEPVKMAHANSESRTAAEGQAADGAMVSIS